jgi:flagellar biogenesis protein FliO
MVRYAGDAVFLLGFILVIVYFVKSLVPKQSRKK